MKRELTRDELLKLCVDASSNTAGFEEHYDFAGHVGPNPVMKLLILNERMENQIEALIKSRNWGANSTVLTTLLSILDNARAAWEQPVDNAEPLTLTIRNDQTENASDGKRPLPRGNGRKS